MKYFNILHCPFIESRDRAVGIATRYGLDGAGIKSRWRWDFSHLSRPALGPPILLYNEYRVFPGGKAAGAWRWLPTPTSAEVKETVELFLYSPSGPSWTAIGWTVPLIVPLLFYCIKIQLNYCIGAIYYIVIVYCINSKIFRLRSNHVQGY